MKRILLSFFIIILSSPAFAVDLSEEKKAELLQEVEAYLELSNLEIVDGLNINIEEKDGYFAVDIPAMTSTGLEGEKLLLGGMGLNAIPGDDTTWNMTLALKKPFRAILADGKEMFSFDPGKQYFKGVWDTRIHNFTKINAKYADMSFNFPENNGEMLIAKAAIQQDASVDNANQLSGPSRITAEKITFKENGRTAVTIRESSFDSKVKGMSFDQLQDFQNQMENLATQIEQNPESVNSAEIPMSSFFSMFDGISGSFQVSDITIYPQKQAGTETEEPINIDSARFGMRMDGLRQDKVQFGLSFGYATQPFQEKVSSVKGVDVGLVPHKVDIDFDFLDLPIQEITEANADMLKGGQANPMVAMMTMPQILAKAGSSFQIDRIALAGKEYSAQLRGTAIASQNSPMGATADFNATITGLDKIMQTFKSKAALSPSEQKIMQTLTMLQLMGQKQGGGDTRTYELKLDDTGAFTINGADLSTLTGMSGGMGAQ